MQSTYKQHRSWERVVEVVSGTSPDAISTTPIFGLLLSPVSGRATRPMPTRTCFEGEIRKVLSNLVYNAIDAMQPQGVAVS
jgi:signal transduction histidine kinase